MVARCTSGAGTLHQSSRHSTPVMQTRCSTCDANIRRTSDADTPQGYAPVTQEHLGGTGLSHAVKLLPLPPANTCPHAGGRSCQLSHFGS
eukprot:365475-Chlamydomonas_euryale.AAC.18